MPAEIIEEGKEKFVKMPKKEFDCWKVTVELAKSEKLQDKIEKSKKEYDQGKSKKWKEVKDEI